MNTRARAARLLAPVLRRKQAFDLPDDLPDAPLCAELCFGTLRWLPHLKVELDQLLSRPLRAKDADIEALMLIGLYQIEQMRIPDHAAVTETVDAARQLGKKWAAGLINAILRKHLRGGEDLKQALSATPAYQYAHPDWMIDRLSAHWPDQAEAIMAANNQRPPMTLRVNLAITDRKTYMEQLDREGMQARPGRWSPSAVVLERACPVAKLPGFAEGLVSIQDEAAQLCTPLLDIGPGARVLDACAAPGGKAGHILEVQPDCHLDAFDIDSERLLMVAENLRRLGLNANVDMVDCGDATHWSTEGGSYDRILLDAPCSGTGVIRRHPDIKWLRRPGDIGQFVEQQQRLLEALWLALKPNGLLLYVTCSIMPEENDRLVQAFLESHQDARAEPIETEWGLVAGSGRQLLPAEDATDGFFFARLKKEKG